MQWAVDIVNTSPHPDNKVAATLFKETHHISKTNDWPDLILERIGPDIRIGDSSGTVHAEVNCLIHFSGPTRNTSLAITDPCCPNCAKCIAEAGIKTVYIDHKGFLKDFANRRGEEFQDMSLRILAHAGVHIFALNRKEKTTTLLYKPDEGYIPPQENPIEILPVSENAPLKDIIQSVHVKHPRWGCAIAINPENGQHFSLVASTHPAIGFTAGEQMEQEGKYDFYLEPVNRLLMGASAAGLRIIDSQIWCSVLPSPREMVNLVGANISTITIGEESSYKKSASTDALRLLSEKEILKFQI